MLPTHYSDHAREEASKTGQFKKAINYRVVGNEDQNEQL